MHPLLKKSWIRPWYALPSHAQTSNCHVFGVLFWLLEGGGGEERERERERLPVEEMGTLVEKYCLKNEQQCIIRFLNLTIHDCEVFERL